MLRILFFLEGKQDIDVSKCSTRIPWTHLQSPQEHLGGWHLFSLLRIRPLYQAVSCLLGTGDSRALTICTNKFIFFMNSVSDLSTNGLLIFCCIGCLKSCLKRCPCLTALVHIRKEFTLVWFSRDDRGDWLSTTFLWLVVTRMDAEHTVLTNSIWIFRIGFYSYQ